MVGTAEKKIRSRGKIRFGSQMAAALVQNADFKGFFTGRIYQGASKNVCVPGLNCYSCPGAIGACPLGSLQNFLGSRTFKFPYYVVGLILFFGAVLGRAVCGFLCPFGFIQELIHKIPFPKKKLRTFRGDRQLRYLKYLILAVFVIILPIAVKNTPAFCKYICPAGTLEGGIPLVLLHGKKLAMQIGALFDIKLTILIVTVILCLVIYRPFCRYICPLGAMYGMLNRVSLYKLSIDSAKCVGCGACEKACPMAADPLKAPNSAECIRCGVCADACPTGAVELGFFAGREHVSAGTVNKS